MVKMEKELRINADTTAMVKKLRAIAWHANALAAQLAAIDGEDGDEPVFCPPGRDRAVADAG